MRLVPSGGQARAEWAEHLQVVVETVAQLRIVTQLAFDGQEIRRRGLSHCTARVLCSEGSVPTRGRSGLPSLRLIGPKVSEDSDPLLGAQI